MSRVEDGVFTVNRDFPQGSGAAMLYVGVRGDEKFDQDGDGTSVHDLLPALVWIRIQSVGHQLRPDVMTYLSVSYGTMHQLPCIELVHSSSERVV